MEKIKENASTQHTIVAAVMSKLEKQGLTLDFNSKFQAGTVENEWVLTVQLKTQKSEIPFDEVNKIKTELRKLTITGSGGRTVFLYVRGPKEAFLELLPIPHSVTPAHISGVNQHSNNQRSL